MKKFLLIFVTCLITIIVFLQVADYIKKKREQQKLDAITIGTPYYKMTPEEFEADLMRGISDEYYIKSESILSHKDSLYNQHVDSLDLTR